MNGDRYSRVAQIESQKSRNMSTRANVVFKDGTEKIVLYHHHDGAPKYLGMQLRLLCMGGLALDGSDSGVTSKVEHADLFCDCNIQPFMKGGAK